MRYISFYTVFLFLLSFVVVGCSGGGGSSTGTNPASNPVPSLSSISPNSVQAGGAATSITVSGSNFISSSSVEWNGIALATTYVSTTSLTAQVPASDLQSAGSATITVVNPGPGGGSSSGTLFTITAAPNPVPSLSSVTPNSVQAGSAATSITVSGSSFVTLSSVEWNGFALATNYVSSTSLTAQVPASYLLNTGSVTITVVNPAPGGGSSNGTSFTITAATAPGQTVLSILANSLAWDPANQVVYLSLPSTDSTNGNSVQIVNPTTGALGASAFAGSEPNLLSVSQNSKYVYVSLGGSSNVQRMTLPGLGMDIEIPLGSNSYVGPLYAMDLQAAPNADGTVAVVRGTPNEMPGEEGGVVIYDDGVARTNALCGFIQPGCESGGALYDSIQWNADASQMFAANNEDTGFDFYTIPVTSAGFGTPTDYPGVFDDFYALIHYDLVTNLVYDDGGQIINPATGQVVGTFAASGLMVPDGALGKAFFIGQTQAQLEGSTYTLESFDIEHFTPIASMTIQNVVGYPTHLIRWGTNGLAFTTYDNNGSAQVGAVYFLAGSFVNGTSGVAPAENVKRSWKAVRHGFPAVKGEAKLPGR
jgi:hypothetical protein